MPARTVSRRPNLAAQSKAQRMLANLRRLYDLGRQANSDKNPFSTDQLAATLGMSPHTLRKARAFARTYSPEDLDRLCRMRRPNGLPLHFGYIPYLLSIREKTARQKLARKAAKRGWTAPQLYSAIRRHYPERRCDHGRRMSIAGGPEAGLERLVADAERWLRLAELVIATVRKARLGREGRQRAREAAEALRRLASEAEAAAREIEKCGRQRLPAST